ncbi:HAD family hydrolase [Solibacillus sp. FSL K6-1523]|uniref:HAD family hydrolase n=1 Tax=Solibacillus sp. FSL K6-1523 TaxID=2921471 RepID=UPI0030F59876
MNFVFDIDGTICFDGKTIERSIIAALNDLVEAGHEVIFASARPIRDMLPLLPKQFHQGRMVGGNGAFTYNNGDIKANYFNEDLLAKLVSIIETNELTYLADSDWDYAYTGDQKHPIYRNINQAQAKNRQLNELHKICKIVLFHPSGKLIDELSALPVMVTSYKSENAMDISPLGINKVKGLHNLNIHHFIAFGNDSNDQCLFENAAYSVCIGNQDVQQYATEKIDRADVAKTIQKLMTIWKENVK